jgi:hypothetical protein
LLGRKGAEGNQEEDKGGEEAHLDGPRGGRSIRQCGYRVQKGTLSRPSLPRSSPAPASEPTMCTL